MQIPIMAFVLLISLVFHEVAHGRMALQLGDDTAQRSGRLTLNPIAHIDPVGTILIPLVMLMLPGGMLFGWAKPVPVNPYQLRNPMRDHALVAAAGPASNLLLAAVCAILLGILSATQGGLHHVAANSATSVTSFLTLLFVWGIRLNIVLALFNLIPIPPLDGSWIVLGLSKGEVGSFYAKIRPFGFLLIIVLMNLGLGSILFSGVRSVEAVYYRIVMALGG
jgi:Zn-dependent protease